LEDTLGSQVAAHNDYKLSVIIPCYNEEDTIEEIVRRVRAVDVPTEIVIVDDGSTDGTRDILRRIEPEVDKVIFHDKNLGKGGAIQTGAQTVTGDYVLIQDADLEYDPEEYPMLLRPLLTGKADVVYGSRFLSGSPHRVHLYWHRVANGILTLLSNMITNLNLTDMETCFKVFKVEILRTMDLSERGFGIEPQITARVSQLHCIVYEIGISYHGRGYEEGKKIGWKDAVWALFCILRYGIFSRQKTQLPAEFGGVGASPVVEAAGKIGEAPVEKTAAKDDVATVGAAHGEESYGGDSGA
jgi:glycosyltransferase involved in cell wall biosynthesis